MSAQHYLLHGGGTGREFPYNLLSHGQEPWNKWYQVTSNQSWVLIEFTKPVTFVGLGIKSANDCPHRDPDEASVSIFNPHTQQWNKIADLAIDFENDRWKTLQYLDVSAAEVSSIIIDFKNNKANEIQLGEIIFYSD